MTDIAFTLTDHDPKPDRSPLGNEATRDWSATEVVVEHLTGKQAGALDSMNSVPRLSPGGTAPDRVAFTSSPDVTLAVTQVRRHGPHSQPIIWKIHGTPPPASLAPGSTTTLELGGRARISTWADMQAVWNQKTDELKRDRFKGLAGLDDISMLVTVNLKDDTSGDVDWADNFLFPNAIMSDARKTKFVASCLQFFHARRVQVFAGVFMDTGVPGPSPKYYNRFVRWLKATGDFTAHASQLVAFFDKRGLDIDGISYDIEGGGGGTHAMGAADVPKMKLYYETVAAELARSERYLAYAAGAARSKAKTFVLHEQPFWLASTPNIIARPMSYDIGKSGRTAMVEYALGTSVPTGVGLHPGQFQVALATSMGGGKNHTHAEIAKELGEVHRRFRVGFSHWNFDGHTKATDYQLHDKALNPDGPPVGTLGQPLQGPLGPQRIAAFEAAIKAEASSAPVTAK